MDVLELADPDMTCSTCNAEFLDPDDLAIHVHQVHGSITHFKRCQFCTIYLHGLEEYALHIRDEHLLTLKCCKYCSRVFNDFDEHRRHESKHFSYIAKSMYACSQCKKLFSSVRELELHEYKGHFDSKEGVFITDCLPLLSSILNYKALKFFETMGENIKYVCLPCIYTTYDPQDYIDHLKKEGCRSYVCDSCCSVYRNKYALIRHFECHPECFHDAMQIFKQCKECFKMFELKMWIEHTKHCKTIKCRVCNIVFSTMFELSEHTTANHPITVTLQACKFCSKEFAGEDCLQRHVERAHKRDQHLYKYVCKECNAIFKHPKNLFGHFFSTHKDLEPYTCRICDKKFKIRKKFTIHIKLDHKSIGYIEFDENNHVFFSDKKTVRQESAEIVQEKNESVALETFDAQKENEMMEVTEESLERSSKSVENRQSTENPKKVTFNVEEKLDSTQLNINSDFMSATETEGNQTEAEAETKKSKREVKSKVGRKSKRCKRSNVTEIVLSDSSEDEPLNQLKKRLKKKVRKAKSGYVSWNMRQRKYTNDKRFVCTICKQDCYTFQNYHNHVALHYKDVMLKCVKCSESFKSKEDLKEHCSKEHSSSQLTETLKNFLEKRKSGLAKPEVTTAQKFQNTIKKVLLPKTDSAATLTEVKDNLSVQKFIENFTPEDAPKHNKVEIDCSITFKPFNGPCRDPIINLTKCNLTHMDFQKTNLAMPVRYRQVIGETHKVTCKEVIVEDSKSNAEDDRNISEDDTFFNDNMDDNVERNESIPDVAQEVMLENSEDPPPKTLYIPHRVVLPELPTEYKKIRIAHLQAEAPYYKIVKVEDVLNPRPKKQPIKKIENPENVSEIKLPDGTKLVTVNPLAHLLGNTPMEKIMENSKNKYYQPKGKDFEVAIAKAMLQLEKPDAIARKRRKKTDVN